MARGRMINKTVAVDTELAEYGAENGAWALVLHHRLIAFLDVNGNVRADGYWLKATIFPHDAGVSPEDCRKFARQLAAHSLAVAYQAQKIDYLHFPAFAKNQVNLRTDRERPEYPQLNENQYVGNSPDNCPPTCGNPAGILPALIEVEDKSKSKVNEGVPPDTCPPKSEEADLWNQIATEFDFIQPVDILTPNRLDKLRTRRKEPLFDWPLICDSVRKLCEAGRFPTPKGWSPRFNWLIKSQDTYISMIEQGKSVNNRTNYNNPDSLKDFLESPE